MKFSTPIVATMLALTNAIHLKQMHAEQSLAQTKAFTWLGNKEDCGPKPTLKEATDFLKFLDKDKDK